ncbi:hypothetical protein VNO78_25745 [Psophocarpus tetragonolobus]|uniref:Uncharacterized protein n=1 Tax=Psophocarpus tetragonolobus TaxID=3891 RepID=A0AAN9S7Y3_PSOTE
MKDASANIPGLENLIRNCDIPSFWTIPLADESIFRDFYVQETLAMTQASALILNTIEQLEPFIIAKLATIFPKIYSVGPLHTLCKTIFTTNSSTSHKDGSLRKEDRSCITWLDHQKEKSVLYVSFGTVVKLSLEQLLELWHGLVYSLKPFLWVIQKDLIPKNLPIELEKGTKERGFLVDWVPQEEVLAHPSVGVFFTHSGWNSTLECIAQGVPMLCWPSMVDQLINSRCVSEQWKIGLNMNGTSDRYIVQNMVKDTMENQMTELIRSATEIAKKAYDSTKESGSSYHNLENLVKDIGLMKVN